jgi:two-component system LytT family response regulator
MVLIADDEPHARRSIRLLLERSGHAVAITESGSGAATIEALQNADFDLLFLDVELGDVTGIEVVREVGAGGLPVTIFVTAYDEYALKAFEVQAIDYLLKPFTDGRFNVAVERAVRQIDIGELEEVRRRIEGLVAHPQSEPPEWSRRVFVRKSGRVIFIPVDEVDWFEAEDYYCRVHTGGKSHLIRKSLNALESELDPARFCRTHRSAIVNLARVDELEEMGRGDALIRLEGGILVRLSRSRRADFERALKKA